MTVTWIFNIKYVRYKPRLYASVDLLVKYGGHVSRFVVGRTRPLSTPLAKLTMKKSLMISISMHACAFVPIAMVPRLAVLRVTGALLLDPIMQKNGPTNLNV